MLDANVEGEKVSITGKSIDTQTAEVILIGTGGAGRGETLATAGRAVIGAITGSRVGGDSGRVAGGVAGGVLGGSAGNTLTQQTAKVVRKAIEQMVEELPARSSTKQNCLFIKLMFKEVEMEKNNTVLGIDQNIEALLCYVLGWITGIVFLLLEKENLFVRFHAMQSLVVFLGLFVLSFVVGVIPVLGLLTPIIFLLTIVLWIMMMIKSFQGEMYKLPWAGDFAEKQIFQKSE
ncbi:MAG: DUF4870 domain-containing protein [Thermodesulfobacteriota bacterium]